MLQFITHRNARFDEISGTRAVLEGGCRWVQLRMKDASDEEFLRAGREVARLCRAFGATFLVDDRVHLVGELGADGVHVGRNDMPVAEARRILGPERIVGATANTFEEIRRAAEAGAGYIGLGPFRFRRASRFRSWRSAASRPRTSRRFLPREPPESPSRERCSEHRIPRPKPAKSSTS